MSVEVEPRMRVPRFHFRPWLVETRLRMIYAAGTDTRRFKYPRPAWRAKE